jgi:Flp pilus assembly protein TadD/ketosteroid isomerase-like protein
MLHRYPMMSRLAAALAATLIGAASPTWSAPADDLRDAQKLYGQGKVQPAFDKVEVFLKAQPRDPQGRFLKGLLLTEQKRVPEAIQIFTGLTEDFPELPEPYNNLAVLYASQGNYDKAKSALELAIHTHPSYATAHENLGDIYAQLASRAYDRALQLDKNNNSAQLKLSMVKDLFSPQKVASTPAKGTAPKAEPPKAEPPKAEPPRVDIAKVEPKAEAPKKSEPLKVEPPKAESPKKSEPLKVEPPKAEAKKAPAVAAVQPGAAASDEAKAQVAAAVDSWAKAWSSRDVKGYLAHYAPDFEVPGGISRSAWEKQRNERITKPKSIEVDAKVLNTRVDGNEATVTIRQGYKSDALKTNSTKTLKLVKNGERWLIKQERVGG